MTKSPPYLSMTLICPCGGGFGNGPLHGGNPRYRPGNWENFQGKPSKDLCPLCFGNLWRYMRSKRVVKPLKPNGPRHNYQNPKQCPMLKNLSNYEIDQYYRSKRFRVNGQVIIMDNTQSKSTRFERNWYYSPTQLLGRSVKKKSDLPSPIKKR